MKITFFSSKSYDQQWFEHINASESFGHTLHFISSKCDKEHAALAKGSDAVCVFVNDCVDKEVLSVLAKENVKYILLRAAGYNNVDVKAATALGIKIARVPAYSPHAVAEYAVALILSLNRKLHKAYNRVRDGNFSLEGLEGFDLYGKKVGVVGGGKIGECFVRIMLGFGAEVLVYDPAPPEAIKALPVKLAPFDVLLSTSDIISLHCPLNDKTHHLIDAKAIQLMKPGVMLINTGRGALVDTKAVIQALKQKHVGALGLDVYEEESGVFFEDLSCDIIQDDTLERLMTFPNVMITSHQGFFTKEALFNIAKVTLENASAFEKTHESVNEVLA